MSTWREVRTLVFDLDDTLFPEREFVLSGFEAAGTIAEDQHSIEGLASTATLLFERGARGNVFDLALQELGYPASPELVADLVTAYRSHVPNIHLFSDALTTLTWARNAAYSLALITDGPASMQQNKIAVLDLNRWIPLRVVTDELGGPLFWKPHRRPYEIVMESVGGAPDTFAYIADNPSKDFITPNILGWRTVRIRRPGAEHFLKDGEGPARAQNELTSLSDLPALLQATTAA